MLNRFKTTTITALSKTRMQNGYWRTDLRRPATHICCFTSLFGETITPALLDLVQPPKEGIQAILFVEGYTDKVYIETALRVAAGLTCSMASRRRFDEGAHKAAVQAILVRQMLSSLQPPKPIGVIVGF